MKGKMTGFFLFRPVFAFVYAFALYVFVFFVTCSNPFKNYRTFYCSGAICFAHIRMFTFSY